ncbi:MAG: hypothetical protein JXA46_15715 [Dehalococcoidales bacterium]|nr:hypothetical protein [Dehalococcoidales bacterium]
MKRLLLLAACLLCIVLSFPGPLRAAPAGTAGVKELNFVFLHGLNGNAGSLQRLEDSIIDQLPAYVTSYQADRPDVIIETSILNRTYPNNVDIESWADNIADSINQRFTGKKNLVLIGHSMGGKTALYTVAHNIGNVADKVAMVVTLNSPIRKLANYYFISGDTALDFRGAQLIMSNQGALESLTNYDSAQDGLWVSEKKHWLAFVSAESTPQSSQYDTGGIDPLPRNMDDTIVPLSCQYSDGADVIYYGEYHHGEFTEEDVLSDYVADRILSYIFGGNVECSVFARGGSFEHKAGLLPGTNHWEDMVGGVLTAAGTILHRNESLFKWAEWEDVVGKKSSVTRSSFQTAQKNSFPFLTGIQESRWLNAGQPLDGRLYLKTRAAPKSSTQVDWSVYQPGLLPAGIIRDHYEVEIETGSQFIGIDRVFWETTDPHDLRLRISSFAQSPFRWFRAQWKVYHKESRQRQVLDSLPFRNPLQ